MVKIKKDMNTQYMLGNIISYLNIMPLLHFYLLKKYWPDKNLLKNHFISTIVTILQRNVCASFCSSPDEANVLLLFELFLMSMYWYGWKRSEQSLYKCRFQNSRALCLDVSKKKYLPNTWFNSHSCFCYCNDLCVTFCISISIFSQ